MPWDNQRQLSTADPDLCCGGWNISELKSLGHYHPLEPSHVSFPKAHLERVLARLTDCLRALSCHVLHEDQGLSAKCQTMEQVEFQINLFKKDGETVVLELQRICGDSFIFHQYVRGIMESVEGKTISDMQYTTDDYGTATSVMDQLDTLSSTSDREVEFAMTLTTKLATTDCIDARRLGIETLEALTDANEAGRFVASKVSRQLLMPCTQSSKKLAAVMVGYLLDDNAEEDLGFKALHVWSNAFQVASHDPETLDAFFDTLCPLDTLMHSLERHVEQVYHRPHEATMALVGLAALQQAMPLKIGDNISWCAVQQAKAVGCAHHAALEYASRKVMKAR